MSEKRRPEFKLVASIPGKDDKVKRIRVEAYPATLWDQGFMQSRNKYRIRVGGRWYGDHEDGRHSYLTLSQIFEVYRRSLVAARNRYRGRALPARKTKNPSPSNE